ncbi:class I SAM-dependent methyltransferase [Calycomorphotria hydatis]|uniref:Uncharacterized protein n=1 Tax=Calycomorphotria hydatis TaxID=2528027 RepID=A0A517TBR2_9PLAN|nr:hypothetical protein [Calycomorphotria hydatis]QDT65809.1 hypothetical protein V22_30710 [Calycomorphotria hydatis]
MVNLFAQFGGGSGEFLDEIIEWSYEMLYTTPTDVVTGWMQENLSSVIECGIMGFICYFVDVLSYLAGAQIEYVIVAGMAVVGNSSPGVQQVINNIGPYIPAANQWLPLNEAAALAVAWVDYKVLLGMSRTVIKFIPTIG